MNFAFSLPEKKWGTFPEEVAVVGLRARGIAWHRARFNVLCWVPPCSAAAPPPLGQVPAPLWAPEPTVLFKTPAAPLPDGGTLGKF